MGKLIRTIKEWVTIMYITNKRNIMIHSQVGDGFRLAAMPEMLRNCRQRLLLISPKVMHRQYGDIVTRSVNVVNLEKLLSPARLDVLISMRLSVIVFDERLPRVGTKAFKVALELCKGKSLVFINCVNTHHNLFSMVSLMLVSKHATSEPLVFTFQPEAYNFMKRRYGRG